MSIPPVAKTHKTEPSFGENGGLRVELSGGRNEREVEIFIFARFNFYTVLIRGKDRVLD